MKKKLLALIMAALMAGMTLTACGGTKEENSDRVDTTEQADLEEKETSSASTLEEFYSANGMIEQANEELNASDDATFESVVFSIEGNNVKYVYKLVENLTLDKESLEVSEATYETQADMLFKSFKDESGIDPESVVMIFQLNSGEEIYSYVRTLEEYQAAQ